MAFDYAALLSGASGEAWLADGSHYQDVTRLVAAGNGDPVGSLTGEAGNFNAVQSVAASKPTLTVSGGKSWLAFDGVDDTLLAGLVSDWKWLHNGAGNAYICIAARVSFNGAQMRICGTSGGSQNNVGAMVVVDDNTLATDGAGYYVSKGSAPYSLASISNSSATPDADLIIVVSKTGGSVAVYVYGSPTSSGTLVTASTANSTYPLTIGTGGGANAPMLGRIYGLVVTDTIPSAADRTAIQNDMSLRTVDNPLGVGAGGTFLGDGSEYFTIGIF